MVAVPVPYWRALQPAPPPGWMRTISFFKKDNQFLRCGNRWVSINLCKFARRDQTVYRARMKDFQKGIVQAAIVAVGIIVLGFCIQSGLDSIANKDHQVNVKGLAEKEVKADKVTWPIVSKELGNDLPELYSLIGSKQAKIKAFLKRNGISDKEILVNAPQVTDLNAQDYTSSQSNLYRYNVTSVITVTSRQVDRVRSIIARQGELLKEGVAIVDGGYNNPVVYEYTAFKKLKPLMMKEAIENAEQTAGQFAENSHSKINKIVNADQGQFSIEDRDSNTPYIKKVRVVTSVTYSLKD